MYQLLTVQTFRPDRLLAAMAKFVAVVMGSVFQKAADQELNLGAIVNREVCDGVHTRFVIAAL